MVLERGMSVILDQMLGWAFRGTLPQAVVAGGLIVAEDAGCRCVLENSLSCFLEDTLREHDGEEAACIVSANHHVLVSRVRSLVLRIGASRLTAAATSTRDMLPSSGTVSNTPKSIIIFNAGRIKNYQRSETRILQIGSL